MLRTDLTYRYNDDRSDIRQLEPELEQTYEDSGDHVEVDVVHRLYQSLDTRYRFTADWRDSTGGEHDLMGHGLNMDYTKRIGVRHRFGSGVFLGRTDTDNRGFADIVDEAYGATAVPGTFALRQQNVQEDTILVLLKSPLPPFDTIALVEGVHYNVNTGVEPFEIEIFGLPPEFVVPGSYDLLISYSLVAGDYELRTDAAGGSLSLDLYNDLLRPYVRYAAVRSDVTSGSFPGEPLDSDLYVAGIQLVRGPVRARTEYQYLDWSVNPYRLWRSELQYIGPITDSINVYSTVTYQNRHYLGGDGTLDREEYTEHNATGSASLTKRFFRYNAYVSVGGSYSYQDGLTRTDAWSANSSLVWHVGKLDVTLGVTAYGSDTSASGTDRSRNHQLVYLNLRRQLW
jgi:hypothetical protein